MNTPADLRRTIYALLIAVAVAAVGGRILNAQLVLEPLIHRNDTDPADGRRVWPKLVPQPMPTFSSNDRSRWAAVRALVEKGTFVIGYREHDPETGTYKDHGIVFEDGWGTVDKVLDPEVRDNVQCFHSSKPPLLTVLVAGEYWLLHRLGGWSLVQDRWLVVRVVLLTFNLLPLVVYLVLLARLVDGFGTSDWGRLFVVAAAGFGTFVTTFGITLNNHTVATCTAVVAMYAAVRAWGTLAPGLWLHFVVAGFFAGFTVCLEMPAGAFAAGLGFLLFMRSQQRALFWFVPAALVPVAAYFLTNYLAVGQLKPVQSEFGSAWYVYEGSHWKPPEPGEVKRGIDWAGSQETKATYALHLLVGHHGLFSLSPIYLLALAGMVRAWWQRRDGPGAAAVAGLCAFLTVVVVGFYILKTENYGGWTCGPRWLMWLTPFFLLSMLPALDWLAQRRWGRGLALVLLGVSVLSASYPAWNPWRHPWMYNLMEAQGWIRY